MKTTIATLVFGVALGVGFASPAFAGSPSDPRAEFILGNVAIGDCSRTGGTVIPESALTFSISAGQILNITAVDPALSVTGIVVKGGDDTNLYVPGLRGLPASPPWENLISPLTNGGQLPAISHWFVCGGVATTTTSTTTSTTTTTTTTSTTSTTTVAPTTSTTTTTVPVSTTTTSDAVGPPTSTTTTTTTTTTDPVTTTTAPATSTTNPATTTTTVVAIAGPTTSSASGGVTLPTTGGSASLAFVALAIGGIGVALIIVATRRRESPPA